MTEAKKNRAARIAIYIVCLLLILLMAAYFMVNMIINDKFSKIIKQLSPEISVSYSFLHLNLLNSSLVIGGLDVRYIPLRDTVHQHQMVINKVELQGISFFSLLRSKKLDIERVKLEDCLVNLDQYLMTKKTRLPQIEIPFQSLLIRRLEMANIHGIVRKGADNISVNGKLVVDSVLIHDMSETIDSSNLYLGAIRCDVSDIRYPLPGDYEILHLQNLELDSRKKNLHIDTLKVIPTVNKFELGKIKKHQMDFIESRSESIDVSGLDILALPYQKFRADKINIKKTSIYVFRDRRLPLQSDDKPMPVAYLSSLPFSIRVQSVSLNAATITYEEFPKTGDQTGTLNILNLRASISPLINHRRPSDPAYLTMRSEGSLMGSGTVVAVVKMPLDSGNDYQVEGFFHDLDVTSLNNPAENLGNLHLESGMLNDLHFWFDMSEEKSTGKIVGEYHDLVADKLKEHGDEKKLDKFKSFFLKKIIIPKDKDRSLPESKRTGKVNYKHDPQRYFSYYLLHSLLVGVKSSFSLGFLLPG